MPTRPKVSVDMVFPYRFDLTDAGQPRQVYDRKKAGVILKFALTLKQAEDLQEQLSSAIGHVKKHIESNEKKASTEK